MAVVERRCPNCGTRVARDAESCFMCGHDLHAQQGRGRRISWIDGLLVLAVLAVLGIWWQMASQPNVQVSGGPAVQAILPTNVPLMTATITPTVTSATAVLEATATPTAEVFVRADGVIRHRVRPGETLLAIAGLYGVTVAEIQAANNLANELIRVGDELIIPITQTAETGSTTTVSSQFEYTVQQGDTVISIASRFGSSVQSILAANGLTDNDVIRPGDVLLVPVQEVPTEVLASTPLVAATPTGTTSEASPPVLPAPAEPIYDAPRLIGPPDGDVISLAEAVLLRWISVDVLAPNEWYVLLVYPLSGSAKTLPSIWTKATSFRLETDLAPATGRNAVYAWQVSVVRVRPGVNNQYALQAASPASELRDFTWR